LADIGALRLILFPFLVLALACSLLLLVSALVAFIVNTMRAVVRPTAMTPSHGLLFVPHSKQAH